MADTDTKMVNIGFSAELLERVDSFRFDNRFPTRVEAIRWLIQAALDKKLKPSKTPKAE
jgi:metal-responsive CopG/Arc/MetJ family transcriptional regulator